MKQKYKEAYMDMAERFGKTSTAVRLQVGCLIVDHTGVIAEGVNGMPPNWPDEVCENIIYGDEEDFWLFDGSQKVDLKTRAAVFKKYEYFDGSRRYRLQTKPECRHAEVAALEKLWNKTATARGSHMFISHSPCYACAIKIKTAGITEVYYRTPYRSNDGINHLIKNGVKVEQIPSLE